MVLLIDHITLQYTTAASVIMQRPGTLNLKKEGSLLFIIAMFPLLRSEESEKIPLHQTEMDAKIAYPCLQTIFDTVMNKINTTTSTHLVVTKLSNETYQASVNTSFSPHLHQ